MYVILAQGVGEANLLKDLAILIELVREEAVETGGLEVRPSWALPYRWSAPRFRIMDWLLVGIASVPFHPQRTSA
jgi:hypothetical protein